MLFAVIKMQGILCRSEEQVDRLMYGAGIRGPVYAVFPSEGIFGNKPAERFDIRYLIRCPSPSGTDIETNYVVLGGPYVDVNKCGDFIGKHCERIHLFRRFAEASKRYPAGHGTSVPEGIYFSV